MSTKRDDDPTDESHPLYDVARDPTHPLYEGDWTDANPNSNSEYKVGPGHPPKKNRWSKGCPSPNPKGRPRKVQTMKPDLKQFLEDALNEKVSVTKNNKETLLTKGALVIQQLVNQCAKGDRYARRDLLQYAALLGVDLQAKEIMAEALGLDDQAIVEAALRRREQHAASLDSRDDHVKAPADLLDDDIINSESDAQPSTAPHAEAKRKPEPILDEHGNPLPVSDIRYIRAVNARNIAQQKKNQGES
jgi:Family of unknown function (DUF5681)